MKTKHLLLVTLTALVLFSCCQKDSDISSGTTDKDQSYIKFMGQRFPLTDGEFYDGELSLYDEDESHDYEINVELWNESSALTSGSYTLTVNADDNGIAEASIELTENDTAAADSAHTYLGEYPLTSASMKVSSADNIYTIAINGMTADGQEVRAHYVGRLYFADKKSRHKLR